MSVSRQQLPDCRINFIALFAMGLISAERDSVQPAAFNNTTDENNFFFFYKLPNPDRLQQPPSIIELSEH